MKKKILSKIWSIFSSFIIFCLVIGGSILAFLYAKGYRINMFDGKVRKTGVLSVQSIPSKATVYVNNVIVGKTPKVISSLDESTQEVKLTKDGYYDWKKNIPVFSEKSSPIEPFLTINNPSKESVFSSKEIFDKKYSNATEGYFLLITKDVVNKDIRKIYRYDVNKQFWDVTENPFLISNINEKGLTDINVDISEDGKWALVKLSITTGKVLSTKYNLIHVQTPVNVITQTDLEPFGTDYKITWSKNSSYLVLESNIEILTYRVEDKTKFLLLKKTPGQKYIWTTDSDGFFYYTSPTTQTGFFKYTIFQETIQGSGKKESVKDIYFANTDKYITEARKDNVIEYVPITNSPESTRFAGEITSFSIEQKTNGIYIKTTLATYWFDRSAQKYILVYTYPADLVSYSSTNNKLLFTDANNKYFVFVFNKDEMDPIPVLGTKQVFEGSNIQNIIWFYKGNNISYSKNGKIIISDFDGDNAYEVTSNTSEYVIDNNDKYLFQVDNITTSGFELMRYQIN